MTTAAAATATEGEGRGKEGTRVRPGHAGEGDSRWTGEGRVNPRPTAQPRPAWPPAPASGVPAGGAQESPAGRTSHGNNRAIGCCCQELNQLALRAAVARRQRSGQRSRAQTKGGSGAWLPPPRLPLRTAPSGSASSRNPAMKSRTPLQRPKAPSFPLLNLAGTGRAVPGLPPTQACRPARRSTLT